MDRFFEFVFNHPILWGLFLVLLGLFVWDTVRRAGPTLSPQELVHLMNGNGALVLDIRDSAEYDTGHITTSINIPESMLQSRLAEIEKFKDKAIVLACKMGQASKEARHVLRRAGFTNVSSLQGGLMGWRRESMPIVKK